MINYEEKKWNLLADRQLKAPYKPKVKNPRDMGNFGFFAEEDCPPMIPYQDPGTGWDREFGDF